MLLNALFKKKILSFSGMFNMLSMKTILFSKTKKYG